MKNSIILFIFLMLLVMVPGHGQNTDQVTYIRMGKDLHFGAKGGILITNLRGKGLVDNYARLGFHFGGLVVIPISGDFYFQPELLFALQGTNGDAIDLKFNYINLPLMGKYHITEAIAAEFGPQIGILIGGNTNDFNLDTNTFDIGLGIGGGYRLNDSIYFQLRANLGFFKVLDNLDTYNTSFQIGACYFF